MTRVNVTKGLDLVVTHGGAHYLFRLLNDEDAESGQIEVTDADAALITGRGFFWFRGNSGLELLSVHREVDIRVGGAVVGRLGKDALQSAMVAARSASA